ncbi:MAG: hypothetical protein LC114_12860, partial [Bryobacterales bacterium]|nr:hypothetical protein [Bryobacterales bacterium]
YWYISILRRATVCLPWGIATPRVEQTVLWSVRDVRQPLLAPICRKPAGSITPKTQWLLYAGNPVAPLCRKRIGSYVPEDDTRETLINCHRCLA